MSPRGLPPLAHPPRPLIEGFYAAGAMPRYVIPSVQDAPPLTSEQLAARRRREEAHVVRVESTLFHELERSLPPYMRTGAAKRVDWESYATLRKKHAATIAATPTDPTADAANGAQQVRMLPPSQIARRGELPPIRSAFAKPGDGVTRPKHQSLFASGETLEGGGEITMQVLQAAADAHRRRAERFHRAGVVNPKLARRDVEMALRMEETRTMAEPRNAATVPTLPSRYRAGGAFETLQLVDGGLKRSRQLKESSFVASGIQPRPPAGGRRRRRKRAPPDAIDGFDGAYSAGPSHLYACTGLDGGSSAVSAISVTMPPMMQPMPRFMGAGPVANGSLLRSSRLA